LHVGGNNHQQLDVRPAGILLESLLFKLLRGVPGPRAGHKVEDDHLVFHHAQGELFAAHRAAGEVRRRVADIDEAGLFIFFLHEGICSVEALLYCRLELRCACSIAEADFSVSLFNKIPCSVRARAM